MSFSELKIRLLKPEGFDEAARFDGFEQLASQSSVLLSRWPVSFARGARSFIAASFNKQGMQLEATSKVTVGGRPGLLFQATQRAHGQRFRKWMLATDQGGATLLITANYPEAQATELAPLLKRVVLSAQSISGRSPAVPDSVASRPQVPRPSAPSGVAPPSGRTAQLFTLKPAPGLAPAVQTRLISMYTPGGVIPLREPGDPLVIAGPSLGRGKLVDTSALAKQQLASLNTVRNVRFTSHRPVRVAGLNGLESVASVLNARSGEPLTVYQVIVFDRDGYFRMVGTVDSSRARTHMPHFKSMMRSLQFHPDH